VMLTMLVTRLKENQLVVTVSSCERIWYLGLAKDKQLLLCLQQKQNTFQLQVVVHNYSRWNISWKIIRLMLTIFLSFVVILLLFVCQRIQFYIQEQSILKSNTILLETVQKGILDIQFIDTEHQWADIFTKPLTVERFDFIKKNLNMHFVSDWNCLLLNYRLGSEVSSEVMVHQKLFTEVLRKICFWRWHQHFNLRSWILCS